MSRTYRRKNEPLGTYGEECVCREHYYSGSRIRYWYWRPLEGRELKKAKAVFHSDRKISWSPDLWLRTRFHRKNRRVVARELHNHTKYDSFDDYVTTEIEDLSWYY